MTGWQVLAISVASAVVVTGAFYYVALRHPIPLLDTSETQTVFAEQSSQVAPKAA